MYPWPIGHAGLTKDGLSRHFFHRPSKAYTTGTRKRRKIQPPAADASSSSAPAAQQQQQQRSETRWHKTGKTRPVVVAGRQRGCKKILVLYTNFGKHRRPEKTNWVMHQYHLGSDEEEKDGELVVSKVFYQTQPRQCGSGSATTAKDVVPLAASAATTMDHHHHHHHDGGSGGSNSMLKEAAGIVDFYSPAALIGYNQAAPNNRAAASAHLMPNFEVHTAGAAGFGP